MACNQHSRSSLGVTSGLCAGKTGVSIPNWKKEHFLGFGLILGTLNLVKNHCILQKSQETLSALKLGEHKSMMCPYIFGLVVQVLLQVLQTCQQ